MSRGPSIHKRERELRKAEKARVKKQRGREARPDDKAGPPVASVDDLRGYYGTAPSSEPPPKQP